MGACISKAVTKQSVLALAGLLIFLLWGMVQGAAAQATMTFKGELADAQLNCLQTPMRVVDGIKDKTACVLYYAHSVQPPNKYVLYDASTKTTYQLDDQNLAQPYVGAKNVVVTGTLDKATKTIHVKDIKVP